MGLGWAHKDVPGRYVLTCPLLADLVIPVSAPSAGSSPPSVKHSESPASSTPGQSHTCHTIQPQAGHILTKFLSSNFAPEIENVLSDLSVLSVLPSNNLCSSGLACICLLFLVFVVPSLIYVQNAASPSVLLDVVVGILLLGPAMSSFVIKGIRAAMGYLGCPFSVVLYPHRWPQDVPLMGKAQPAPLCFVHLSKASQ